MINNYSICSGGKYFGENWSQNYLVFQLCSRYLPSKNGNIGSWQSKGMSEESATPLLITGNSFDPEIIYNYGKGKIKFKGICLKQDSVSFIHMNVINVYISYELDIWSRDLNTDSTLGTFLFRAVKLTENADPGKNKYIGYSIGCDAHLQFLWSDGSLG